MTITMTKEEAIHMRAAYAELRRKKRSSIRSIERLNSLQPDVSDELKEIRSRMIERRRAIVEHCERVMDSIELQLAAEKAPEEKLPDLFEQAD